MWVAIIKFPLVKEEMVRRRKVGVLKNKNPKGIEDKAVRIKLLPPSISKKRR
jgi:hypothetical protein